MILKFNLGTVLRTCVSIYPPLSCVSILANYKRFYLFIFKEFRYSRISGGNGTNILFPRLFKSPANDLITVCRTEARLNIATHEPHTTFSLVEWIYRTTLLVKDCVTSCCLTDALILRCWACRRRQHNLLEQIQSLVWADAHSKIGAFFISSIWLCFSPPAPLDHQTVEWLLF